MRTPTPGHTHSAPDENAAVCWLLDVYAYGITAAAKLHPTTDPWPEPLDGELYRKVLDIIEAGR